jgi:hypothetical protein
MVYAPRNEEEIETVRRIVAAAVWWVAGVDVDAEVDGAMDMVVDSKESVENECHIPSLMRKMSSRV